MSDYIKQLAGKPFYEELVWNKPETKKLAGKLLIVGGNMHAIAAPSKAFVLASRFGAGEVKVVMPDKTKKLLGPAKPAEIELTKSTPSGSFSKESLNDLLAYINWADTVLLAGDFGRNSETAILLEQIVAKTNKPIVITKDTVDYFVSNAQSVVNNSNVCMVLSFAQLQKVLVNAKYPQALTFSIPHNKFIEMLDDIAANYSCSFITAHHESIYLASGKVSVTKFDKPLDTWRLQTATSASVWWMQNQAQPFKALTTSVTIN